MPCFFSLLITYYKRLHLLCNSTQEVNMERRRLNIMLQVSNTQYSLPFLTLIKPNCGLFMFLSGLLTLWSNCLVFASSIWWRCPDKSNVPELCIAGVCVPWCPFAGPLYFKQWPVLLSYSPNISHQECIHGMYRGDMDVSHLNNTMNSILQN